MKTTTTTTIKSATKAITTKPAKATQSRKASPKAKNDTPVLKTAENPAKATQSRKAKTQSVFSLVAGTLAIIEHKGLKKAISYHITKGNLEKTDKGIKLTAQGATAWKKERQDNDPQKFAEIAAFVHSKGDCPKEWKTQPATKAGPDLIFPNMLYWGSFSTMLMRQAFATLWAK